MELPPDEVLRQMAKMAMETATESLARMADQFAADPGTERLSGPQALKGFAQAIRNTNSKQFPRNETRS